MKKILLISASVIVCFLVGFIGSRAQVLSLETWYPTIIKSPLTPPNVVFPIVWAILYLLMGISVGLILASTAKDKRFLIILFCVQLFVNWLWSQFFFAMQNPMGAFVTVIVLDTLVLWYIARSYGNHKTSSLLFVPYAVWILFASYLNLYIMINN